MLKDRRSIETQELNWCEENDLTPCMPYDPEEDGLKDLSDFNRGNMGRHLRSVKLFEFLRNTVRSVYREHHRNPKISKAFMSVEDAFNHLEFQGEFTN